MKAFFVIWAGQVVSILGSSLSGFALGVWLYAKTGSSSNFALVALCTVLPQMLVSPLVGGLTDRYSRRWMMLAGDSGAAFCTLVLAGLFFGGLIQPWHIFLLTALSSACGALQAPAYAALTAGMLQHAQLGRANGLVQVGQGLAEILAPGIAGVLLSLTGVAGVLAIDLLTYVVAVGTLLSARLQETTNPVREENSKATHPVSLRNGMRDGWQAIKAQPGLVELLRFQALFSFLWSLFAVLVSPMVLGFTGSEGLGLALTAAGLGMLAGSLVLSAWGGPRQRMRGLLGFELASAAAFVLMGLRPNLALVAGAACLAHFTLAFVSGLNQSIWQSRVEIEKLGRVLAVRQLAVKGVTLLAYLVAGGLADRVLEPLMREGGALAAPLGGWIGAGPGRGIAALFVLIGVVKALAVFGVYRTVEQRSVGTDSSMRRPLHKYSSPGQ